MCMCMCMCMCKGCPQCLWTDLPFFFIQPISVLLTMLTVTCPVCVCVCWLSAWCDLCASVKDCLTVGRGTGEILASDWLGLALIRNVLWPGGVCGRQCFSVCFGFSVCVCMCKGKEDCVCDCVTSF